VESCRSRRLDERLTKLKARFCVRGDRQKEGVDYFDTFAPVVSWQTVRLMLVLSVILDLATKQVDYTAAFVHAPIDEPPNFDSLSTEEKARTGVYVAMPRGFSQPNNVLKLKKSLYGLKQAPRNFFLHLKGNLESIGFISQQDLDPCLFISDKVICLVYVDDTLFYSSKESYIDDVIQRLKDNDMDLHVEGEVAGFLGVHISRDTQQGSITLTQTGLINRIIEATGVLHMPIKYTPASSIPLVKDDDGEQLDGTFNYSSVVGMLQYLQNHTRPDITYVVSQCVSFVNFPSVLTNWQSFKFVSIYAVHQKKGSL
jgi:Reverse transcriptase (RNA-dependent DNA polymerase)